MLFEALAKDEHAPLIREFGDPIERRPDSPEKKPAGIGFQDHDCQRELEQSPHKDDAPRKTSLILAEQPGHADHGEIAAEAHAALTELAHSVPITSEAAA